MSFQADAKRLRAVSLKVVGPRGRREGPRQSPRVAERGLIKTVHCSTLCRIFLFDDQVEFLETSVDETEAQHDGTPDSTISGLPEGFLSLLSLLIDDSCLSSDYAACAQRELS